MKRPMLKLWVVAYIAVLFLFSLWTFSLTDPNLVLTSWQPYWSFQQWMWQTVYPNKLLLISSYATIVSCLFLIYLNIIRGLKASSIEYQFSRWQSLSWIVIFSFPLLFSYNALSHDVFNYIFNSKMILAYGANPYTATALNFPQDSWTRFMHNTHTFAPYGYGWTAFSLVPFLLGMSKFTLTWLIFRFFGVLGLILLFLGLIFASEGILKRKLFTHELALLFLNPLVLIEVVVNMHNDIWMLVPAVWAVGLSTRKYTHKARLLQIVGVCALLVFSILTKYATVLIAPMVLIHLFNTQLFQRIAQGFLKKPALSSLITSYVGTFISSAVSRFTPTLISLLLFVPLLTDRSQQFHSWYLLWPLVWLPLIQFALWKKLLLIFTFTCLLRYIPWMYIDGFAANTLLYQKYITWSAVGFLFLLQFKKSHMK